MTCAVAKQLPYQATGFSKSLVSAVAGSLRSGKFSRYREKFLRPPGGS